MQSKRVKAMLERQADRRRQRRVRALQNIVCAALAVVCILCLIRLDAEDRAIREAAGEATEAVMDDGR